MVARQRRAAGITRRIQVAAAVVFIGSGCLCGCPADHGYKDYEEYRKHEIEARTRKAQPVIDALEKYKAERGEYPAALNELVDAKMLAELPDLAAPDDHQGKPGRIESKPLEYEVDEKGTSWSSGPPSPSSRSDWPGTSAIGITRRPRNGGTLRAPRIISV